MKVSTKELDDKKPEIPTHEFESALDWSKWLVEHHSREEGIWLRFFKKGSGVVSINYDEALDEALCYGWIDGQVKRFDAQSYLQKFTPRRSRSVWSKRNVDHVARLIAAGKMTLAGLKQVDAAKADGRWQRAYDSPSTMRVPDDFLNALAKNRKAKDFFQTLNRANLYAIAWRLQTAKKAETRERRLRTIIEMLEQGKRFH